MHGAGNDYIYVDCTEHELRNPEALSVAWSKPHTGIGSDGLILVCRPSEGVEADFKMHIYNADGSEAMMCGNGARCVGKFVYDHGLTHSTSIRLETLSGIKIIQLHPDADGQVSSATVDMLEPSLHCPAQYDEAYAGQIKADFRTFRGTFVSMGNPHFVCFVDDLATLDIARYGRILEHHEAFPERCNIEFAQVMGSDTIRTRVWERGSGITMACGTGACATAVAAAVTERASRRSHIVMDGGQLDIHWQEESNHVYLTGPAATVFEGEIDVPELNIHECSSAAGIEIMADSMKSELYGNQ